jgi:ribosome-binding protein aMBF1 (putative translation factor)
MGLCCGVDRRNGDVLMTDSEAYEECADIVNELPELLRTERERRELSYRQVADEMGVSHSAISHWEHRGRQMNTDNAVRVLQWLADSARDPDVY